MKKGEASYYADKFHGRVTASGEISEGEMEAASEQAVIERLKEIGHLPVRAEQMQAERKTGVGKRLFGRSGVISRSQLTIITRELARLIEAGVSLDKSLTILVAVADDDAPRNLLTRLIEQIRGGSTFADAIAAEGAPFSRLYVSMVRAGEAGGWASWSWRTSSAERAGAARVHSAIMGQGP